MSADPSDNESAERAAWLEEVYAESPHHQALGVTLKVDALGEVVVAFDGAPAGYNRSGHVAGGAIASMIDSAVVQAVRTRLDRDVSTVTIDLKVNFIYAGDGPLRTHGRVDHLGRSTAVGHARTYDLSGRLVAMGIATVAIRGRA